MRERERGRAKQLVSFTYKCRVAGRHRAGWVDKEENRARGNSDTMTSRKRQGKRENIQRR